MSHCFCSCSCVSCSESWIKLACDPLSLSPPSMTFLLPRALDDPGDPWYFWASGGWVRNRRNKGSLGKGWNFNLTLPGFCDDFLFLLTELSADGASIKLSWTFYIEMSLILIEGNGSFQFFVYVFGYFPIQIPLLICVIYASTHFVKFFVLFCFPSISKQWISSSVDCLWLCITCFWCTLGSIWSFTWSFWTSHSSCTFWT